MSGFKRPKSLQQYDGRAKNIKKTVIVNPLDPNENRRISSFITGSRFNQNLNSSKKSPNSVPPPLNSNSTASSSYQLDNSATSNKSPGPTRRQILSFYLNSSYLGRRWDQLDSFINILMCTLYIYLTTYITKANDTVPYRFLLLDSLLALLLFVVFIPRFYVASDAIKFSFSPFCILSFITTLAPFIILLNIYFDPSVYNDSLMSSGIWVFLYPIRFIRIHASLVKVLASTKNTLINDPATNQAIESIFAVLSTVLSITSLTHIVLCIQNYEAHGSPVDFFDVLFFTAVSSVTGLKSDVAPDSTFTRLVSITVLFLGIFWLPQRMSKVFSLISDRIPWDTSYCPEPNQKHVIIIGDIWFSSLFEFLREFYCEDHGPQIVNTNVILMSENPPSKKVLSLINNPVYTNSVKFVLGSPTSYNDLEAVNAHSSSSIFVLSDKLSSAQSFDEDSKKIMICLAIKRFLNSKNASVPIYAQALMPETSLHLDYITKDVICIPELRLGLLSVGINLPGFSSLLQGLFTSIPDNMTYQLSNAVKSSNYSSYLDEYISGLGQEIYPIKFSPFFKGMRFSIAANHIYKNFNSILFAIKINPEFISGESDVPVTGVDDSVYLNPSSYVLTGLETGFIISTDYFVPSSIRLAKKSTISTSHDSFNESESLLAENESDLLASNIFKSKLGTNVMDSVGINKSANPKKDDSITANKTVSLDNKVPENELANQHEPINLTDESIESLKENSIDNISAKSYNDELPSTSALLDQESTSLQNHDEENPLNKPHGVVTDLESSTHISPISNISILNSKNTKNSPNISKPEKLSTSTDFSTDNAPIQSSSLLSSTINKVNQNNSNGLEETPDNQFTNHLVICCTGNSFPSSMEYLIGSIRTSIHGAYTYNKLAESSKSETESKVQIPSEESMFENKMSYFFGISDSNKEKLNSTIKRPENITSFPNMQPIVFLCSSLPDDETKKLLEHYGSVYFVVGTPLSKHGLIKANITSALKAIVLLSNNLGSNAGSGSLSNKTDINITSSDSPTLLTALNIEYLTMNNKNFSMHIEFNYRENMKFIGSNGELVINEEYIQSFFRPCFMSGNCFAPVMLDTLICQSFYNKDLISIIKNMIFPYGDITHDVEYSKMVSSGLPISEIPKNKRYNKSSLDSSVFMIPVPDRFVGKNFSVVFSYFMFKHKTICLGLYRNSLDVLSGQKPDNSNEERHSNESVIETYLNTDAVNYFVANPNPSTILNSSDRIYILSTSIPEELSSQNS
ncbi:Calcium-activated potassium channel slowpoke [Smittium culicis]|uniref:Calcium-activated potassium channel slowpoke n=1 Tax=Smittium culicis TaxID=133412 RepID=A0A1R1YS40_9FUNG|nr:Calcium-activated potassium channel slowpoke [Smittium culicis]